MSCPRFLEQELFKSVKTISRSLEGRFIASKGDNFGEGRKFVNNVIRCFQRVAGFDLFCTRREKVSISEKNS